MADRTASPAGPPRRRWRRALGIALGALLALAAIAWGVVAALFPPARVRALVEAQLERSLRRETRFTGAGISVWPPVGLRVSGLQVAEPGGFAAGTALGASSVRLDLDLFGLIVTRRLVVARLEIVAPFVHLVLRPDGSSNLDGLAAASPAPAPGAAPPAPLDLLVRDLEVHGGRFQVDDQRARRRIAFGLDTRLGFSSEGGLARIGTDGKWRITDLAFGADSVMRRSALNRSLAGLAWNVEHRGHFDATTERLTLDRLALSLGPTTLAVSGTVDHPGAAAVLDLRSHGERLDLARVLGFLAAADLPALRGVRGAGEARFDLAIRGGLAPGQRPEVTGTIAVANGSLRYPGAPAGIEGLGFAARLGPDQIEVPDLAARVAGQPLAGRIAARHLTDPVVWFALKGDLDLAAIGPLVAPKDARLAGRADLDVSGEGRARDPGSIALNGRVALAGVTAEAPGLPRKIEGVSGTLSFSPASAELQSLTARAGASSFTMSGSATRPLAIVAKAGAVAPAEVQFKLDSPYLDLAELLPPGPSPAAPFNARGVGEVAIARLRNQKLDLHNVRAKVTLAPGRVEVPSFTFDGYGGAVRGTASFDVAKSGFAVKGHADSVRAGQFLSAFTPAAGMLDGSVNADFDLSGAGAEPRQVLQSLTAIGLAAVTRGHLRGPALDAIAQLTGDERLRDVSFDDMHLPFRVERGRVVTDPVRVRGPYGDWSASGAVGFDGALDYAVTMALPRDVVQRIGGPAALLAAGLADAQGRTVVDLDVSGNAKAPRVALDMKAMQARLVGHAGAAADAQREKLAREALEGALGKKFAPDSAGRQPSLDSPEVRQAVQKKANQLLEGLFGRKKPAAPPPDSAARAPDSTRR